jgi:voltage-gated potassium channel
MALRSIRGTPEALVDGPAPHGHFALMSRPFIFPYLAQLAATMSGRRMTAVSYLIVAAGLVALVILTVDPAYEAAHRWVEAALWVCLAFFAFEWLARLVHAIRARHGLAYALSGSGLVDVLAAIAVPIAIGCGADVRSAWLLGVFWLLKLVPGIPGLRRLRRVLVLESGPLLSVLVLFLMVLLFASVAVYVLERNVQPAVFGSLPATLWWAVVTLTTVGYGDVVPVTPLGRIVAAMVMICGLGVFGLWTGILATGFATETRRDNFLKTWDSVSKVPFFASLGPAAIADVTHVLRTMDLPPRTMIVRKGQPGDCMYFIASGEVEVDLPGKKVRLGEGDFFGEMALLGNRQRSANIMTTELSRLLVLDLVDFHVLMARHPDLAETIDTEANRRAQENK